MGYLVPTEPLELDINIESLAYVVPLAPLEIDLEFSVDGPGITYPIPPSILVTNGLYANAAGNVLAMQKRHRLRDAAAKEIQRVLRADSASQILDKQKPQGWDAIAKVDGTHPPQAWNTAHVMLPSHNDDQWHTVPKKDDEHVGIVQPWDDSAGAMDTNASHAHRKPVIHDVDTVSSHDDSAKYWDPEAENPFYIPPRTSARLNFSGGAYRPPGAEVVDLSIVSAIVITAVPTRPVDTVGEPHGWTVPGASDLRIRHPWDTKPRKGTEVDFGYVVQPNPIVKPPPAQPIIRESYLYMNASSLKKLPENIALSFANLLIRLDIDSFSWEISATILNKESMDLIRPGPSGPVEVEATVNGHVWRFMIEQYSLNRKFPKETYTVSGSSLTQLLASPYSAKTSSQIGTEKNALQIAQDVLEYTEFDIVWDASLADYTVPANVWGYESKTRLEVIDELVKASGGVVIPHMSDLEITASHRYALGAPWNWGDLDEEVLDAIVADSIVMNYASSWQPATAYNAVYVSGVTTGVAVDVRLTGTAGDIPAPDIYDHLNLTTAQCRGRGVSVLGQSGDQEIVTIEVPLPTSGSPGLVLPAHLIEYRDTGTPANSWRGLVLETSVNVSKPGASRATQTLKIERHHY